MTLAELIADSKDRIAEGSSEFFKDAGCIDVLSIDGEELTSRSQTESTRKGA